MDKFDFAFASAITVVLVILSGLLFASYELGKYEEHKTVEVLEQVLEKCK